MKRNRAPLADDPSLAVALVDDMDLPDGAYFAMLEEMTGMDAVDAFMAGGEEDDDGNDEVPCLHCDREFRTLRGVEQHERIAHPKKKRSRK